MAHDWRSMTSALRSAARSRGRAGCYHPVAALRAPLGLLVALLTLRAALRCFVDARWHPACQRTTSPCDQGRRHLGLQAGFRGFSADGAAAKEAQKARKVATVKKDFSTKATQLYMQALGLADAGSYSEAKPLYKQARVAMGKAEGRDNPDFARICGNLGAVCLALGEKDEAARRYVEARDAFAHTLGTGHAEYASCCGNLGRVRLELGDYKEAETLLQEAMRIQSQDLSAQHAEYLVSLRTLRRLYHERNLVEQVSALTLEERRVQGIAAKLGM